LKAKYLHITIAVWCPLESIVLPPLCNPGCDARNSTANIEKLVKSEQT